MIRFIGEIFRLVGGLLDQILGITITYEYGENIQHPFNFGVVLIIVIMITLVLKVMFGGKGD